MSASHQICLPGNYIQYFVCGNKIDYQGHFDNTDTEIRFFCANGHVWYTGPGNATRCNQSQALEYLSAKQNGVDLSKRDNFFIVRADVTLTRVKIKLEDL